MSFPVLFLEVVRAASKMDLRFEREVDGEGTLDIMARGECGWLTHCQHVSVFSPDNSEYTVI